MIFLPYKLDFEISRLPIITIVICIICVLVFWNQSLKDKRHYNAINKFCQEGLERGELILLRKVAHEKTGNQCEVIFEAIREAPNPKEKIQELALQANSIGSFTTEEDDYRYRYGRLEDLYSQYEIKVPKSLTLEFAYDPSEMDLIKMVTSTFSHGDLLHLLGNLLFFYIFAASVELLFGIILYVGFISVATIGTSLAYSYTMIGVNDALPTIGLSGVVMAAVAALAVMMPLARIRCFFWFIIIFKVFRVPALFLALWYIGWDIYEINAIGNDSYINYAAHVSGAGIGALFGLVYFLFRKDMIRASVSSY
ncbi:MAG: rhomboid family intramembrane serine protease [Candidatus Thiodiazotropha sp. (ex Notomyrtea botanica)]|nr:rhomboid family intramembrane serine protease [Candidatus Thiodiazotropha sp. (ex Notomyrtea botanica)]